MNTPYFVFDVESIGLHGEGFAVGWVVTDGVSKLEEGILSCEPMYAEGDTSDRQWVEANIAPLPKNCADPVMVRNLFWERWMAWKDKGAIMVSDCGWPVEARFLIACIDENVESRKWSGPYPLHDIASMVLIRGRDPVATNERQEDELPAHNPLNDARQSARLLVEALSK